MFQVASPTFSYDGGRGQGGGGELGMTVCVTLSFPRQDVVDNTLPSRRRLPVCLQNVFKAIWKVTVGTRVRRLTHKRKEMRYCHVNITTRRLFMQRQNKLTVCQVCWACCFTFTRQMGFNKVSLRSVLFCGRRGTHNRRFSQISMPDIKDILPGKPKLTKTMKSE